MARASLVEDEHTRDEVTKFLRCGIYLGCGGGGGERQPHPPPLTAALGFPLRSAFRCAQLDRLSFSLALVAMDAASLAHGTSIVAHHFVCLTSLT